MVACPPFVGSTTIVCAPTTNCVMLSVSFCGSVSLLSKPAATPTFSVVSSGVVPMSTTPTGGEVASRKSRSAVSGVALLVLRLGTASFAFVSFSESASAKFVYWPSDPPLSPTTLLSLTSKPETVSNTSSRPSPSASLPVSAVLV